MASFGSGRFREFIKKYGKVALGVHLTVSAASITGLYIAIKNNVDVESLINKWNIPGASTKTREPSSSSSSPSSSPSPSPSNHLMTKNEAIGDEKGDSTVTMDETKRNQTTDVAVSAGGALALALICNKALFPVRVPITITLTPPVARFLARKRTKSGA